jgi:hypothetical protein
MSKARKQNTNGGITTKLVLRSMKIIGSGETDPDTRDAIINAFIASDPALATLIERAEAGEEIWDMTGDPPPIVCGLGNHHGLAELIIKVLTHPELPKELLDGILDALCDISLGMNFFNYPEVMRDVLRVTSPRTKRGGKR